MVFVLLLVVYYYIVIYSHKFCECLGLHYSENYDIIKIVLIYTTKQYQCQGLFGVDSKLIFRLKWLHDHNLNRFGGFMDFWLGVLLFAAVVLVFGLRDLVRSLNRDDDNDDDDWPDLSPA